MRMEAEPNHIMEDYSKRFVSNPLLDEFKSYLVPHRVFAQCQHQILCKIARPGVTNILSVVGPTGAGKTQLLNEVGGVLLGISGPAKAEKEGVADQAARSPYLPVVVVTANTGRTFESRFRNLLVDIVSKVNPPAADLGVQKDNQGEENTYRSHSGPIEKLPIARLEHLARSGLSERKTRAVLIDEAQHLAPGNRDWHMVGDGLKLLGSISGTLVVLFGTSELLGIPFLSPSIGRRSRAIHFRRYLWQDPDDQNEFGATVALFSERWPKLLPRKLLVQNLKLIYAGSNGCVGNLTSWLYDSMAKAEQLGLPAVSMDILKDTAFSVPKLRKYAAEAEDCEREFNNEAEDIDKFAALICDDKSRDKTSQQPEPEKTVQMTKGKNAGRKPGDRKPSYDDYDPELTTA